MGYMRHHAIVVTSYSMERLSPAYQKAADLGMNVSDILHAPVNGIVTFLVGPDGSKEGWDQSDHGDRQRAAFIRYLETQRFEDGSTPLKWVEVQYGDDDHETAVTADSDAFTRDHPYPRDDDAEDEYMQMVRDYLHPAEPL